MIYVDNYLTYHEVPNGSKVVKSRWSHLTASTTEELHAFAARLGLRRSWFQPAKVVADNSHTRAKCPERIGKPFPGSRDHYDVTEPVRAKAIRLGAVPVEWGREPWRSRKREERESDEQFTERPERPAAGTPVEADRPTPAEAGGYEPVNDGSHYGR